MSLDEQQTTAGAQQAVATGIYVASRASIPERPMMWQGLRLKGWPITSTWIDEAGEGETESYIKLWQRIHNEIAASAGVLLYAEVDDFPLKGALVECGIALGMGKPVAFVLPDVALAARSMKPIGSWAAHPNVRRFDDLAAAKDWLLASPRALAAPAAAQGASEKFKMALRDAEKSHTGMLYGDEKRDSTSDYTRGFGDCLNAIKNAVRGSSAVDGWCWVPPVPTETMVRAAAGAPESSDAKQDIENMWSAMLEAAPAFAATPAPEAAPAANTGNYPPLPDAVAHSLGLAKYAHSSNIFAAHEFTPDAEHADEWEALHTASQMHAYVDADRAARGASPNTPEATTTASQRTNELVVITAASQWACERTINDWDEGDLMKAVASMKGDWPGCEECNHDCDEPCMPHTVADVHADVDERLAQLVHERKLIAPIGYAPPAGWKPVAMPETRRRPKTVNDELQTSFCDTLDGTRWRRLIAFRDVSAERNRQDEQWGGAANDDTHSVVEWSGCIMKQLRQLGRKAGHPRARLVKIAALAIAAIESNDRITDSPKGGAA